MTTKRCAGALTVSDGCARGVREDVSGRVLAETLTANGWEIAARGVTPDDLDTIAQTLIAWSDQGCDAILTTGGTGFSPRDVTPEATRRVIEREVPGLAELLRWTGYQKLPRAVLSRGVAGIRGATLIVNLPGSTGGVRDGLEVLLPLLPHAIALLKDEPVDHTPQPEESVERLAFSVENPAEETRLEGEHESPNSLTLNAQRLTLNAPQTVAVLETNLDDFSPEFYEVLMERLFAAGAVDVFLTPIQMKKGRPATLLTALAPVERRNDVATVIFTETSTLGLRHQTLERLTLLRRWETVETVYGPIRIKIGTWQGKETTASPEYEDVKAAALAYGAPIKEVYAAAQRSYVSKRAQTPE